MRGGPRPVENEDVRPHQRAVIGWAFSLFFCVFASWYVLRPLRDAMGIAGNTRELPRLFLITLGITFALTPAVSALVSRLPRRRILPVVYRFLIVTLVVFFLLLRKTPLDPLVACAFFVWASVLNLLAITLAWALMADVFSRTEALRWFGLIGGGGTLGAILGSLCTTLLVDRIGTASAVLIAAALLEAATRCAHQVSALAPSSPSTDTPPEPSSFQWLRQVLFSRYFLGICAYVLLFTFTSSVLYFEQGRIIKAGIPDTVLRAQLFAKMDLAVNLSTFALQLFVAGRVLRRLGVAAALALLPLVTLGGFVALRIAPIVSVLVVVQVVRRTLDFACTKPAREVLFTVVAPEDKYRAKSFIDTFVYRSGDALAALSFEGISAAVLVGAMGAICAAWAMLGVVLGRAGVSEKN